MDFLGKVVDKVTDWLIESVVQEIGYFFTYESNITSLDNEFERLENIRSGVQLRVEAARRNLHVISPNIQGWSTHVDTITAGVATILRRRAEVVSMATIMWISPILYHLLKLKLYLVTLVRSLAPENCKRKGFERWRGNYYWDMWYSVVLSRGDMLRSSHKHQCKVTFTTRFRSVCEEMKAQKIMEVGTLYEEEAWILFRRKVGNSVDDPSLLGIAKEVAKECKGLPLAIITVARALKKHKTKRSWNCALEQLRGAETISIPEVPTELYKPLRLSYDYLGSNEAKYLFLLCSLFEEDSNISPEELLGYGSGLRIFRGIENLEQARDRVCLLLEILKDGFLLSQGSFENYVKMHDVVRAMALSIASEGENNFMVSHHVNSEEFPRRTTYEHFSHMSIVANKFDELPRPIVCPKLKLLMLKLCFKKPFKLQDNFFNDMGKLNVLSLSRYADSILPFPASIQRNSQHKRFSVRGAASGDRKTDQSNYMLELRNEYKRLERISADVIYSHLSLSSKLARYALTVGSSMHDYDKVISLEVTETAQLDDWICHLLKESEFVDSTGDGSNNVLTELQLNEFQNIKYLRLSYCKLVTHLLNISRRIHEVIKFPNLYDLKLEFLECLTHFCNTTVEGIEFPRVRKMLFHYLPEFQNFWPTANNSITHSSPLFDEKVCCPRLEEININGANNISALCSHQLPAAYFSKLETLYVANCGKLRNLMPPSVARGLLNLQKLEIRDCLSMEEVITKEKQQGEGIMTLFPLLEKLELYTVPKLGHFFLTECTLEIPFLKEVHISDCPEMKTFVQQGIFVSTPSLESVNNDDKMKVVDLNKAMFSSKVCCPSLEELLIWGPNSISALYSQQFPTAYFSKLERLEVKSCGKLRNLMSPSVARGALNLRILNIIDCESMKEVITEEEQGEEIMMNEPLFSLLENLELARQPKLGHFFLTEHALKFSFLKKVLICHFPEMKPLVQQGISVSTPSLKSVNNDDEVKVDDLNKAMFNYKVSCPNLEYLYIYDANSISALCSHQLPTAYFSKLETLHIMNCGKLRNLMSPSVARGLLNLRKLDITDCDSMEEVITKEEQKGEGIMTLFPLLKHLTLQRLPKLGHFFLTECTLEIPILRYVLIDYCPEMKTFVQQGISVSTPSLESVNNDDEVKVDDLNKWTQQRFNSKEQSAGDGNEVGPSYDRS
ncbi:hypothetical protein MTR67_032090 [Solanum verrucosum]|uniref:NB-ARC domain-containing protein n=1 Tax=Solanum verrucosum TaxID=315347 RepID=A0AAF0ZHC9_SOLVR|nr:hypothetical protein MTR67_032090 [Solanum verrucosum]